MAQKFQHFVDLNDEERKLIEQLEEREEHYKQGERIRRQGDISDDLFILKSGWIFSSYSLDQNVRSIFDVHLHGDVIGLSELSFQHALYDMTALTEVTICPFPKSNLHKIFQKSDKLNRTFFAIVSREQSMLYERIVSLGRRTALEKVAHFLIEISVRLNQLDIDTSGSFKFPIKQEHVADLLGLSAIHVNRSMNELKRHGYIEYDRTSLKLLDKDRLFSLAGFNQQFLEKPSSDWHNFGRNKKAA
jgi:CRP-like cAMP-binding protein